MYLTKQPGCSWRRRSAGLIPVSYWHQRCGASAPKVQVSGLLLLFKQAYQRNSLALRLGQSAAAGSLLAKIW